MWYIKIYISKKIIWVMEGLKKLVQDVESSNEFKKFKDDIYLCSLFNIIDKAEGNWQIDYYNPKKDKIVSFIIENGAIRSEESKIFRGKEAKVAKLDLNEIKINLKEALNIVNKIHKDKYLNETVNKKIVILQVIEQQLWNITFITAGFNIINFKLNAVSGELISDSIASALSLGRKN